MCAGDVKVPVRALKVPFIEILSGEWVVSYFIQHGEFRHFAIYHAILQGASQAASLATGSSKND